MVARAIPEEFLVADAGEVEAALDQMAAFLHARFGPAFALVGVLRRGAPIAERLATRIEHLRGAAVPTGAIELKRYSDELALLHHEPARGEIRLPFVVRGATVILIDDVLYTGRTFLAAASYLIGEGAAEVACAALCSRGGQEVPIAAAVSGLDLHVGGRNLIEVRMPPFEAELGVVVRSRRTEPAARLRHPGVEEGGQ